MIIRVQTSDGIKRIECQPSDTLSAFYKQIESSYDIQKCKLYRDKQQKDEIKNDSRKKIDKAGLKHGDIIFMQKCEVDNTSKEDISAIPSTSKGIEATLAAREKRRQEEIQKSSSSRSLPGFIKEDQVDVELWKTDGLIERPRDPNLCKHGANSKCLNCVSIEPYDEGYLKEIKVKHMSFQSYLRKMTRGIDKGKFAMLENISCKIKEGCGEHPPWPLGICTKCQPSAVTLSPQIYRHVDNIVFQNTAIVEEFLNYWRATGHQRIGYLYGFYEVHKDVPLGVKATVVAIYEPPQQSSSDYIRLSLPDENTANVEKVAEGLGLQKVGWIFTDLVTEDIKKGTVKYTRNGDSYFLSAQECIMAGYFQTAHPNTCRLSPEGYFGSKFVTVVVTGDKENQIHMEGYQVSNQCMALVRDNCLLPTKDAPELAYVKETSKEQYVPDVFFTQKDKFNNEIKQVARLLPIEYLLIDVPVSTPKEQLYMFNANNSKKRFPIENRMLDGHLQDFSALIKYLDQFAKEDFYEAACDFHFLVYIATMDMLPLANVMKPLLTAITQKQRHLALEWCKSEKWATVEQLIASQKPDSDTAMETSPIITDVTNTANNWSCKHCTFENTAVKNSCEMCGLPK